MPCNYQKLLINIIVFSLICLAVYVFQDSNLHLRNSFQNVREDINNDHHENNLWCIFTKANKNYKLRDNFRRFIKSVVGLSTIPLSLNIISDNSSVSIAQDIINNLESHSSLHTVHFHDVQGLAESLQEVVQTMQQHFNSQPGSYYSDVLFFLSLGLYRVTTQFRAIMIDIDTELRVDIRLLFDEFNNMPKTALVAAAPEQSPVYRHILHMYRAENRNTTFGNPITNGGNPGLNSGVLLLNLAGQRESKLYQSLLTRNHVAKLCAKYLFHGHLGDQDWYTLVSQEHPELIHFLDCSWNRQLCLWWRHHGYHDVFDLFHYCLDPVKIYHGNCNTEIPSS